MSRRRWCPIWAMCRSGTVFRTRSRRSLFLNDLDDPPPSACRTSQCPTCRRLRCGSGLYRSPGRLDEPEDCSDRDCEIDDGASQFRDPANLRVSVAAEADKALDLLALQSQVPQSLVIERSEMIDCTSRAELDCKRPNGPSEMSTQKGTPNARTAKERRRSMYKEPVLS